MGYETDPRIDTYLSSLPAWQQKFARKVRDIVHDADPEVQETVKRATRPYFVLKGNICALLGTKDHLNIFIYDPVAPDPEGIVNQGHGNATARAIQVYESGKLNETALLELFRAIIKNNRSGGWRKIPKRA